MTDLDIDKALALAIGWTENRCDENGCLDPDVITEGPAFGQPAGVFVWFEDKQWREFRHKDPGVIWPIAERYCCFPSHISNGDYKAARAVGHCIASGYECLKYNYQKSYWESFNADNPATAVAMAVIGKAKK